MFEKYVVMTRGFKNVTQSGETTGFQLLIRIPYYRGVFLSLLDWIELTVDGETFKPGQMTFSIGRRHFPVTELDKATDARWSFGEPAVLTVQKPGGLSPGMHDVKLLLGIRKSYVPMEDPNGYFAFAQGYWRPRPEGGWITMGDTVVTKRLTLVQ